MDREIVFYAPELDDDNREECAQCWVLAHLLGYLGEWAWFRCRQCGWEFNVKEGN